MLYRSICHQVSNQADKLALLAGILLLADVSPTYSSGRPQWQSAHCLMVIFLLSAYNGEFFIMCIMAIFYQ